MSQYSEETIRVDVKPRKVGFIMAAIAVALGACYSIITIARFFAQDQILPELYAYFDLVREANLPTYISALYLLSAGCLLALITLHERGSRSKLARYWLGLTIGFIYMSVDEATGIHEGLVAPWLESLFGRGDGIWYFGWTRAFIPLVLVIAGLYIPFLKRLPTKYTKLFVLAGVVYVVGAVGTEMIGSYVWVTFSRNEGVPMSLLILIEEMLEMLGVVIFVYALLSYISDRGMAYHIRPNRTRVGQKV